MDVFRFREHIVGEYEPVTRSFAYTEHDPPTTGQYFADYNPCPTTEQKPFDWNPECFAPLHTELDACYVHLGGLTRDELCHIRNAKCVMGTTFKAWVKLERQ
jgi:hypothetical protein